MRLKPYPFDKYGCAELRVIIDTDYACEGDDAFAVAHALLTTKFDIRAINAANFAHEKGSVQRSYDGIRTLVKAMELTAEETPKILMGSEPMKDEKSYAVSPASGFIVEEALREDARPLFVVVQGAITNLAVALRTCPGIAERINCIWIGGGAYPDGGWEFNASNDIAAANVVMDSHVRLWQVPQNVYSMMHVGFSTLYREIYHCGAAGKYLCEQLWECNERLAAMMRDGSLGDNDYSGVSAADVSAADISTGFCCGECWILGDSPVVGLMLNGHVADRDEIGAPLFLPNCKYVLRPDNPRKIFVYRSIDSQFILRDFFDKMQYQYA